MGRFAVAVEGTRSLARIRYKAAMPASFSYPLIMATALVPAPATDLTDADVIPPEPVKLIIIPAAPPPPPFIYLPQPLALPTEVRLMIETAIADGNEAAANNVIAMARKVAPRGDKDIDAIENAWKHRLAAKASAENEMRIARLRNAGPFDVWSGNAEFGGFRSTGTSSNLGAFAALSLERATIDWSHKLVVSVDAQETNRTTSADRLIASWQPNYRFSKQAYTFGIAQYERDPFAGYDARATVGMGMGYRPLNTETLKLELEGGPAIRYTLPIEGFQRTHLVGRGSFNLQWQVTPTLKLTQKTAVFLESEASNAVATTSLDTKLIGKLKSRISYNIQYEGNTPLGTNALNTQSRVTFLYGF